MQIKSALSLVILSAFSCAGYTQLPSLTQGLPGIDGLGPILQPGEVLDPVGGALGQRNLADWDAQHGRETASRSVVGGLPGIDGLNFSPVALQHAFRGLDPALVRALLGDADPALIQQLTQDLTGQLPGLDSGDNTPAGRLPGLDGLPVKVAPADRADR